MEKCWGSRLLVTPALFIPSENLRRVLLGFSVNRRVATLRPDTV
jgi:hypothetical protein